MPETSTLSRSTVIAAPAAAILPRIADLTQWKAWSPWEGQDPELQRSYTGVPGSVGAGYAWKGNRKAGAGSMLVTAVEPTAVAVDLVFTAPFASTSSVGFALVEADGATTVTWTMVSPVTLTSRILQKLLRLDRMIEKDLDKGLAQLQALVEGA